MIIICYTEFINNSDNHKCGRHVHHDDNWSEAVQRPRDAGVHPAGALGAAVAGHLHAGRAARARAAARAAARALQGGEGSVGAL